MTKFNLNLWLRKNPQPSFVLADEQRIDVGGGGRNWRDLTRTIETLLAGDKPPKTLKAMDAQGKLIRAYNLSGAGNDDEEDEKPVKVDDTSCPTCGASLNKFAVLLSEAVNKQPVMAQALAFIERQAQHMMGDSEEKSELRDQIDAYRDENAQLRAFIMELQIPAQAGDESAMNNVLQLAQSFMAGKNAAGVVKKVPPPSAAHGMSKAVEK